ncbi:hypothetical protein HXX25_00210 [Hyphobacterium sp. CCMP332]|uniref:hypothetical protein n=1 Tax=Hyphobacterium sp. CCMP332 TaxID=2749086 RepID=UPI00164F5E9C|nr:hypothetical protein [Hyphobacterium sp. CCMP332]QNL17889.1 hypothetical protein HXX25_00210 [Hyphobacterium sp. CCMP332]
MNLVYIFSPFFDPADTQLSRIEKALRAEGYIASVIAERSHFNDVPDNTVVLRNRALAILIFGSQLIIAAIVFGYFTRFLPTAMTVLFWSLVAASVFIASRHGRHLRDRLVDIVSFILIRAMLAQKKPCAVWVISPWHNEMVDYIMQRKDIVFIADFQSATIKGHKKSEAGESQIGAKHILRDANVILGDPESDYGLDNRKVAMSAEYAVDVTSAAAMLSKLSE